MVVVHRLGLVLDHNGAVAARVLGGDASGAFAGVAALCLDAADGHHHGAGGVGVVGALDHAHDDVGAAGDFAGRAEFDLVAQAGADECVVHGHQAVGQWHAHVVFEVDGGGTGAAFGSVDDDEVGCGADLADGLANGKYFSTTRHTQLEPRRFTAGQFAHLRDEFDEFDRGAEHAVGCGADAVLAHGHVADFGDFFGDLVGWQHATDARLGALADFQFDHLDLVVGGAVAELSGVEVAVVGAGAEVAGTHLPDEVAAEFLVVRGDAAFAGVVGEAAHGRSLVQCAHGVFGQGAEAHGGHVQHRNGVRLGAVLAADEGAGRFGGFVDRRERMYEVFVVGGVDVLDGAEGRFALHALCAFVNCVALIAVEGATVPVAFDEVLAQFGADIGEQGAHVPEYGVVAQDRVFGLSEVVDGHAAQRRCDAAEGDLGKVS